VWIGEQNLLSMVAVRQSRKVIAVHILFCFVSALAAGDSIIPCLSAGRSKWTA
jgi:hypothetical protein